MYNIVMKTIKETVKIEGLERKLIKRNEKFCIYEYETGRHWDVMVIQRVKNDWTRTFPNGAVVEMKEGDEYLPSSNQWGQMGWTFMNLELALQKFNELVLKDNRTTIKQKRGKEFNKGKKE